MTNRRGKKLECRICVASESDAPRLPRLRYELRWSLDEVSENQTFFIERCTAWMQPRLREGSNWRCWVAETTRGPVGNVWLQMLEKIPHPNSESECYGYLTNLYVRE